MADLHAYQVGQPYLPGWTSLPEGVQYSYHRGAHELLLSLRSPSEAEIRDLRRGQAEFRLFVERDLIVLLYRFGQAIPWSDAPYCWHAVPAERRSLPKPSGFEDPYALMNVVLVDAADGIVRGLRVVSLSPAFSTALHLAIRDQAGRPFDEADYDRQLAELYQRYPRSDLLASAVRARTLGGR